MVQKGPSGHMWALRFPHGPLTRYAKLRVAHAPEMPGTFSPPHRCSDPDMHHGTCVTHVPWCIPGLLISGFLWSRWWGKRSRRMRNPQLCVSGKRPMNLADPGEPLVFPIGCPIWDFLVMDDQASCNVSMPYKENIILWPGPGSMP